jgi:hypothetical protein
MSKRLPQDMPPLSLGVPLGSEQAIKFSASIFSLAIFASS